MAIASLETAIRLSPHSPELWQPMNLKAYCLLMLNRYEEAVEWARRSIRAFEARLPRSPSDAAPSDFHSPAWWPYAHLASALGHLGRADEARTALDRMLLRQPDFSRDFVMRVVRMPNPGNWDHWFEGLQNAGWQE